MSQLPMSRNELQNLKQKKDEEDRVHHIKQIIYIIYNSVISTATKKTDTSYKYQIHRNNDDNFYAKNMTDILKGLQELFPDCSITHTLFAIGTNGKMYDISKLDDTVLPFVNTALNNSFIVIDWS
jgi:hypothetical protein